MKETVGFVLNPDRADKLVEELTKRNIIPQIYPETGGTRVEVDSQFLDVLMEITKTTDILRFQ